MSRHNMTNPDKFKSVNYFRKNAIKKFLSTEFGRKILMIQHGHLSNLSDFSSQIFTLYGSTVKLHNDQYGSCAINDTIP